ncbi:MAG TPA: helix-turn-helix domain-containing protein [Kofleriaceae bacterium]|nr:helix-turn-helix domain-containing protein [Kofleriaceae bacterium]
MPRRPADAQAALYVKLPADAVDRLHRAAEALGMHKKDLVAGLLTKYVDPDSRSNLAALGTMSNPRRATVELSDPAPALGTYSFQPYDRPPYDPPEVMNAQQCAELLQLDEREVLTLAEDGELPGKKLGKVWRFSRSAIISWLGQK